MPEPPRDASGAVIPHDDPSISDDDFVVRYIPPDQLTPDGAGGMRISSGAFCESSGANEGMSVDLGSALHDSGLAPSARTPTDAQFGAVAIRVSELRALGLQVGRDPIDSPDPGERNPYHVQVWGIGSSRRIKKALLSKATWLRKSSLVR